MDLRDLGNFGRWKVGSLEEVLEGALLGRSFGRSFGGNFGRILGRTFGKHVKRVLLAWVVHEYAMLYVSICSYRLMEGCFQNDAASRFCAIIASVIDCMRVLIHSNRMAA